MRLLVISRMFPCLRHPASGVFFANLLREAAPALDEVVVVTPRPWLPGFMTRMKREWAKWHIDPVCSRDSGMKIIRPFVPALRGAGCQGMNAVLMRHCLRPLLRSLSGRRKFDILLGHNLLPEGIAAGTLAKTEGLPVVNWCIGSDANDFDGYGPFTKRLVRRCISRSQLVLTTSRALRERVRVLGGGDANVRTFYRGIDLSSFHRPDAPREQLLKELGLDPSERHILFVGRLMREKGIFELAGAAGMLGGRYRDLRLVLIGEEMMRPQMEAALSDAGMLQRTTFTGLMPHSEVARYMRAADLLVLPSWAEGLPNAVLEAMASGLPVVSTDVGGIPEVLDDGVTGLLVPPGDAGRLGEAVSRMLSDKALSRSCTHNAEHLVRERFDVRKNAVRFCELLRETRDRYLSGSGVAA